MDRRRLLVGVLVGLLVVTAGCSEVDLAGLGDEQEFPSEINSSVLEYHEDELRAAGSFNATSTTAIRTNKTGMGDFGEFTVHYAVDHERNRTLVHSPTLGSVTVYVANDTTYTRTSNPESNFTIYRIVQGEDDATVFSNPGNVSEAAGTTLLPVDNVTYEFDGTTTVDGVQAARFVATGFDNVTEENESLLADGNRSAAENATNGPPEHVAFDGFNSTIIVGADGIVRRANMTITAVDSEENVRMTYVVDHRISDVGNASIDEPDWVQTVEEKSDERPPENTYIEGDFDEHPKQGHDPDEEEFNESDFNESDFDEEEFNESDFNESGFGNEELTPRVTPASQCDEPILEGEFETSSNDDGTVDVTFTVTTMENSMEVIVARDGKSDNAPYSQRIYEEDESATVEGVESGTTVVATTENSCGDETKVTHNVD